MSPGARYIALVFGLLGLSVATVAALIGFSASDPSFAVEKDYYSKAVRFDELRSEADKSEALGWSAEVRLEGGALLLRVEDAAGAPVEGLSGDVEAFANARASHVLKAAVEPLSGGEYRVPIAPDREGIWELRGRVRREGDTYLFVRRVEWGS